MTIIQPGRTTRQMKSAPLGAVYVWGDSRLEYPKKLARSIGREDLDVRPLTWLGMRNVVGRKISGLVLDHAAPSLSNDAYETLFYLRMKGVKESS